MCGKNTDLMCVIIFLFLIRPLVTPGIDTINEGVQKVFGTLDLFVSLLETEIKYPILQGGILPFWTPSSIILSLRVSATLTTSLLPLFHAFFFVGLVGFILLFGQYFF